MTDINLEIARLVQYGVKKGLLHQEDAVFAVNRILALLKLNDYTQAAVPEENLASPQPILNRIIDWAAENGLLESNSCVYRDLLDTELMACLMPRPSEVIYQFRSLFHINKKVATDYFYRLSQNSNYIRTDRVKKDEKWTAQTPYGPMDITINLSKPEKDPKAIAAARNMKSTSYPKCLLCRETEGYAGSVSQPPRGNHRVIPMDLCGETWYFQYSPYVYYNEHCILLNGKHVPMKIERKTFARLLAFVEKLPHYFIGSNADLPTVGGSILSHDHFQGGCYELPMAKAPAEKSISFDGYPQVDASIVKWPLSVIRLSSVDQSVLIDLADKILFHWRSYSDSSVEIRAFTGETPHNTITPIARRRGNQFELDLVLRNNRTSQEHPLGIFHPHAEYHHLKKENIGLIEVMGLAVLPARLKSELALVEEALTAPEKADRIFSEAAMAPHYDWYRELRKAYSGGQAAHAFVQDQVGRVFSAILENSGVYKTDETGRKAFLRFIGAVNGK